METQELPIQVKDNAEVPQLTTTIFRVENMWNISNVQDIITSALNPWRTFQGELPSGKQLIRALSELADPYFVRGNNPVSVLREYIIYYQHAYNTLGTNTTPEQVHVEALQALRLDMDFLTIGAFAEFEENIVEARKQPKAMRRLFNLDNMTLVGAIRGHEPSVRALINNFKGTEFMPAVQAMVNYRHDYQMDISLAGSQRVEISSIARQVDLLSPQEIQKLLTQLEELMRKLMAQLIRLGLDQNSIFNIALSRLLQSINPSQRSQLATVLQSRFALATQSI